MLSFSMENSLGALFKFNKRFKISKKSLTSFANYILDLSRSQEFIRWWADIHEFKNSKVPQRFIH